jgi:hypothetical protein
MKEHGANARPRSRPGARPGTQDPAAGSDELPKDLTVVREIPGKPYEKGGRVTFTSRVFLRIIHRLEIGWAVVTACQAEGFTYRRFRQLCCTRPSYQRRFEIAEKVRADYRRERCEHIIQTAATQNWTAAAWWLERSYPDRYALKSVVRDDGSGAEKLIGELVPESTLLEYAAIMSEVAQENAREAAAKAASAVRQDPPLLLSRE